MHLDCLSTSRWNSIVHCFCLREVENLMPLYFSSLLKVNFNLPHTCTAQLISVELQRFLQSSFCLLSSLWLFSTTEKSDP